MANFCKSCGAPLKAGARFCAGCGRSLNADIKVCTCGTPLKEGARFCAGCGKALVLHTEKAPQAAENAAPAVEKPAPDALKPIPTAVKETDNPPASTAPASEETDEMPAPAEPQHGATEVETPPEQNICAEKQTEKSHAVQTAAARIAEARIGSLAPSACGESVLGSFGGLDDAAANAVPGTAKLLATSLTHFFSSLKAALKNPKTLIIPLVLAGLWLILDILQMLKVDILPARVLSFLTFAKGGLYGGTFGFIGGTVGKGLFAGALTSLAAALTRKNNAQKLPLRDALKRIFGVSSDSLCGYLAGIGTAMLLYLFISGGMAKAGLPVGLAAAYLTAQATLKRGFLQNLIGSFTAKGKTSLGSGATGIIKGMTAGFAAAAAVGQLQSRLIILLLGILSTVGGIVLAIVRKNGAAESGKEAQRG